MKLRIFDFDDTLFYTNSQVIVRNGGKSTLLNSEQFATFVPKKGDELDFTQFDQVIDPKPGPMLKVFERVLKSNSRVVILTARTMNAKVPVMRLLRSRFGSLADRVEFVGVGDSDPAAKLDWVIRQDANDIYFVDDSHKNVTEMLRLNDYLDVKVRCQVIY